MTSNLIVRSRELGTAVGSGCDRYPADYCDLFAGIGIAGGRILPTRKMEGKALYV